MKKIKILLVDDEKQFVSALAERLSLRGLDADWVTTANEALERAGAEKYDLAILDVKMPQVSGLDLKKDLEGVSPGTRFIFFTGHGSEKDFQKGRQEGACYLVKPLNIEELIQTIQSVMERPGE